MRLKEKLKGFFDISNRKRRIAGLCCAALAVLFGILTAFTDFLLYYVCVGLCVIFIITAVYLIFLTPSVRRAAFKRLGKMLLGVTEKIAGFAERAFTAVANAVLKLINKLKEKFSFGTNGSYRGRSMAKDYVDIKEKVGTGSRKILRKRRKKYKDMDNVERIRFLYERKVAGAVKNGVRVKESMTPNEAGGMMIAHKHMKNEGMELIDKYNFARYDDEVVITDDMVERVRKL